MASFTLRTGPKHLKCAYYLRNPGQQAFILEVVKRNLDLVDDGAVLEIGSHDVNGTMRATFREAAEYVGVDLVEGPGVDLVAFGHVADFNAEHFDITVSAGCFEHDKFWPSTLKYKIRLTRPSGLVLFTCGGRGRLEHGTTRIRERRRSFRPELNLDLSTSTKTFGNRMFATVSIWIQSSVATCSTMRRRILTSTSQAFAPAMAWKAVPPRIFLRGNRCRRSVPCSQENLGLRVSLSDAQVSW